MLLALSPVLIGIGEAFHVTAELQENAALDLLHSIFETAFSS